MTNLDSILKSRDITLPTKVRLVKAMVFPVVMYGCESWTVKKAEHRRIDAFELWCWRRILRVPWTARRSNQSILKEISPGCPLEGLMLKLKFQYFGASQVPCPQVSLIRSQDGAQGVVFLIKASRDCHSGGLRTYSDTNTTLYLFPGKNNFLWVNFLGLNSGQQPQLVSEILEVRGYNCILLFPSIFRFG